mgnify:CR=1 FL=1
MVGGNTLGSGDWDTDVLGNGVGLRLRLGLGDTDCVSDSNTDCESGVFIIASGDIVFLETLSGTNVYTDQKWANPFLAQ